MKWISKRVFSQNRICAFMLLLSLVTVTKAEAITVTLNPGDNIQTAVNANAAGTTFLLNAGTYRGQSITPKAGNIFDGQNGAVLNGSKLLTSWTASGSTWYVTGQTQQGGRNADGECLDGYPRCAYPESVYIDDVPQRHVATLGEVGAGKYYFDYAADRIYIGTNPAGHIVETSVTPIAFGGGGSTVTGVVIKNMTIEKYATQLQFAAVDSEFAGINWVLQDSTIRLNHGEGVNAGPSMSVLRNKIINNGQMGYSGMGSNFIFEGNEIASNGYNGVDNLWEGGGGKVTDTTSGTIRGNCVHDNAGPGIWQDVDANNVLIENNVLWDNTDNGIMYEISSGGVIRGNTAFDNGIGRVNDDFLWGPQILISCSNNVQVYNNIVDTNSAFGHGITIVSQDRPPYSTATGNMIHNNDVTLRSSNDDYSRMGFDAENVPPTNANVLSSNTYHVASTTAPYWRWPNPSDQTYTLAGMQGVGQESGSTVNTTLPTKPVKSCAFLGGGGGGGGGTTITIGETSVLPNDDTGNANELDSSQVTLSQTATIQSLSFYVATPAGQLILGIYDDTGLGGRPGVLKAKTPVFTAVAGWNTVNVITPVSLSPGTYWLGRLNDNNGLHERFINTGASAWVAVPFSSGMPATSPNSGAATSHWSFYATLTTGSTPPPTPTATISASPTSVTSGGSSTLTWSSTNATSCTASGGWSGTKATSGTQLISNILATATYTLTCSGTSGNSSPASATVTVTNPTFTIGETAILPNDESGNANEMDSSLAVLTQTGTIKSLSFYVPVAAGQLILGIYDATGLGGRNGVLKAKTPSFTPTVGWNTVNVITPVSLAPGNYWLAKLNNNNGLHERTINNGSSSWVSRSFNSGMPSTSPNTGAATSHWSFYATFE